MFPPISSIFLSFNRVANINKAGLIHLENGRVLLCRKRRGTTLLILPGGKMEGDETPIECLRRECHEELGEVEIAEVRPLGTYESIAAGTEGKTVRIELFAGRLSGTPTAQSEIGELVWFGPDDDPDLLAPSLRDVIFPDLRRRALIPPAATPAAKSADLPSL
jgi:8-oxo-dGTP diphosphatase